MFRGQAGIIQGCESLEAIGEVVCGITYREWGKVIEHMTEIHLFSW